MGPKLSVSVRVAGREERSVFAREVFEREVFEREVLAMSTSIPPREMPRGLIMCLYIGSLAACDGRQSDLDHFLRKRSNRTTSAPPWFGAAGSSAPSAGSVAGVGTATADGAGAAGNVSAETSATSEVSNWRPNFTDGSRKLLMALNGTTSRSGMPPKDRPTSKRSSSTVRSQNWCCRMIVISSGYWASSRDDNFTPSAFDTKVMKK